MGYRTRSPSAAKDIIGGIGLVWLVGSLLLAAPIPSNAVAAKGIPGLDDKRLSGARRSFSCGLWSNLNRHVHFAILNGR